MSATTGAIEGKITDVTGASLSGVTIVVSSDAVIGSRGTRTAVSGRDGRYWFPALPPGDYSLLFTLEGFRTFKRQAVYVGVGSTATVNSQLAIATLSQSVTVERRNSVFDAQSTAVKTSFDARQLANLPGSRSMIAILAATPAVDVGHFEVGGSSGDAAVPYGAYGTHGLNRPMVEGINVAGIFPSGFALDFGSFSEVSVGTAVHGAEWPVPGVQMQFTSKSGGNRYHATLYADYEDRDWQSYNIDERQITRGAPAGNGLSARAANRLWSYRDINGDVGGYIKQDSLWWYASFRDQDVAARQVNFPVNARRTHLMNYTAKGTYRATRRNNLVMYGQSGRNHQPNLVTGFTLAPTATVSLDSASTAELRASGRIWKAEWTSIVNERTFFEIRVGHFGTDRRETPNGTALRFEDVDTSVVSGGNRDWQENRRSNQVLGSVSHFKDGWLGKHHLKIGGETFRTTVTDIWRNGYPGDVLHVLRNGEAAEVYLFQTPSVSENALRTYAAYASDSWQLSDRLSVTPGLRFDRYRIFFPEQVHPAGLFNPTPQRFSAVDDVIDWNLLAPRAGAIYDLSGRGTTLLKFNYGQYRFGPGTNVGPNANPNPADWWQRYPWIDLNKDGLWERGEERANPDDARGRVEGLDPRLRLPILNEIGASGERELSANIGIRTGVVWRGERQHYLRQNANRPFDAFTVPILIPDPGPDGSAGTQDDGPAIHGRDITSDTAKLSAANIVRNVPDASSHYWTWDVTATRQFSKRWSLVAAFAHTWNYDQANAYSGQPVRQNPYPLNPNDLINADKNGRYEFRTWSAKVYGTYEGPWDLRVTPYLRHQSGQPFGRTFNVPSLAYGKNIRILAEPIDTRRMDNITIVDMRIEKGFRVAHGGRVAAFADVFNLLNANPEETVNWLSGPSFLQPLSIVAPRIVRIGARFDR